MRAKPRHAALVLALLLAPLAGASPGAKSTPPSDVVWHWYAKCPTQTFVAVEVSRNGKSIYAATFPMCHVPRAEIVPEPTQRIETFTLRDPKKSVLGEPVGTRLEGNVWEKGRDTDYLLLGISFMSADRVWLNTFAPVYPDRASEFALSQDIIIRTHPVKG
jgi:hypothetical protein